MHFILKFMYSEKATKFCEISTVDLSNVVPVKSTVEILQNFLAFSEYMNFTYRCGTSFEQSEICTYSFRAASDLAGLIILTLHILLTNFDYFFALLQCVRCLFYFFLELQSSIE